MGLFDKLKGELIDVIEWTDDSRDAMVHRFERRDNEIKMGARLTVRESQAAVFVNNGQMADVFPPGMYTLETDIVPVLTTLKGWKHGFHSPFKAEVYFVNTRQFADLKWGTKNPITLRDPEFGPVRLRAFGTYVMRVKEPGVFIKEVAGTDAHFSAEDVVNQIRNLIVARFSDILGESKIPVLDLAGNYDELGKFITERIQPDVATFGLELGKLLVENISLPPEVEAELDKRTSMGVIGDLSKYTQYTAAKAMEKAAGQPGGVAGDAMGMAMGIAMANQMGQSLAGAQARNAAPQPPPLPGQAEYHAALEGKSQGPFDPDTLRQFASAGRLTRDTLVWKEGMAAWIKAGEVAELAPLFKSAPPPLPPTSPTFPPPSAPQ